MTFEYFYKMSSFGEIEIEDVGNFAIECYNDNCETYYMIVITTLGMSEVFQYGPSTPDFEELPKEVDCYYKKLPYSDNQLAKLVNKFINNSARGITQIKMVDKNEALDNCKSIIEYMRKEER